MELKWGHLCSDVVFESFGAGIVDLITGFAADPGQPPKIDFPAILAFRVLASSEAELEQDLYVVLTDTRNEPVAEPMAGEVLFTPAGEGCPLVGGGKIRLDNKALPSVGAYSFDFIYAAKLLGKLPFTVYSRLGKDPVPKLQDPASVRLEWAHLMLDVRQNETRLFNLVGIFEFLPPTGERGVNLKDWLVLLQIEADPTINIHRQLRVELLDGSDQPAKDASGRRVTPMQRPIQLRRPSVGSSILTSMAPIRFKDDIWLPPGNYRFRCSLDGNALGTPLDVTVLHSLPV